MKEQEPDLLGQQMLLAIRFRESQFANLTVEDVITASKASTHDIFTAQNGRWFMRSESIPGDLTLKALAVDDQGLYLETAPLDEVVVHRVIEDDMLPVRWSKRENCFFDLTTKKKLISLSKPQKLSVEEYTLAARCLWTISFNLSSQRINAAVRLIDRLYSTSAFSTEGLDMGEDSAPPQMNTRSQRPAITLRMGMMQIMSIEQRPILSTVVSGKTTQRMELSQLIKLQFSILNMSRDDLLPFIEKYVEDKGERAAVNLLDFTLARKIKDAAPEKNLTWRQARELARRMARRPQ